MSMRASEYYLMVSFSDLFEALREIKLAHYNLQSLKSLLVKRLNHVCLLEVSVIGLEHFYYVV